MYRVTLYASVICCCAVYSCVILQNTSFVVQQYIVHIVYIYFM